MEPGGRSWGRVLKVARKVYKTVKTGTKVSVKGILKSEALDIADNVYTILDADASGLEKGFAAFDLSLRVLLKGILEIIPLRPLINYLIRLGN